MDNFDDFATFLVAKQKEVASEIAKGEYFCEGIGLSQIDVELVSKISYSVTLEILRQYDSWKSRG